MLLFAPRFMFSASPAFRCRFANLSASLYQLNPEWHSIVSFRLSGLSRRNLLGSVPLMQSHELLREVLQQHGAKKVAADMGLSLSMIYKWTEPSSDMGSGAANPLDRLEALLRSTQDTRLVQWICQRAGGFFIKNPHLSQPHPYQLIPATNEIVQEFADLLAVIAQATLDNKITRPEAQDIRARWEELKSVTEGFVCCSEAGNFSDISVTAAAKNRPPA